MSKYAYRRSGSSSRTGSKNDGPDDEGRFSLTRYELMILAIAIARISDALYGPSNSAGAKSRESRQDT
jgi:hypothetical protein